MFAESSFLDDRRILGTIKIKRNIGTKRFKSLFTRGFKLTYVSKDYND